MFEPMELINGAVTKAISIGGGDGNVVEHVVRERTEGIEFFAVDTDAQALRKAAVGRTIRIGSSITRGLDVDASPEVGRNVTDEDHDALRAVLEGADMVFIAAGMGGGTDTDVAPVVAEVIEDLGILTVTVVTKPFNFEGKRCMTFVGRGITELSKHADSLIAIPNDKLLKVLGCGISPLDVFGAVNDVLKDAAQSTAELITHPGLMNMDFASVHTVMSEMGYAVMGSGVASGEDRAEEATEIAISSPLLEDIDLSSARGVPVNITAGFDLRLDGPETMDSAIRAFASGNATVVVGTFLGPDMNDKLRVTVVVTGIGMDKRPETTLVTNKQVQRSAMDRYQQHGMAPLTQE